MIEEKIVEFLMKGNNGSISHTSTVVLPRVLPKPDKGLKVLEMPSNYHNGIAIDRNGDYSMSYWS